MILADTLADELRSYSTLDPSIERSRALLDQAPKFVFEHQTARLAADAVAIVEKVAAHVPVPESICWIEFHNGDTRCGVLIIAEDESLRRCRCIIARRPDGAKELTLSTDIVDLDAGGLQGHPSINQMFVGALALLGAPSLVERRPRSLEKLNRARARKDKTPLYDHAEIQLHNLDLARPQFGGERTQGERNVKGRQREHFKRAYLRFRQGQMELVRPHWRGDASLGTVNPAYRVRAA